MSKKLQDQPTTTTQPTTLVVIIGGAVKLLNWSGLTTLLGALYAPLGRTINGHSLNADVTITKSDLSLGNVTNDAQLKAADLDTDVTLAANSDTKVPSQKAVKAYADSAAAAAAAAVVDSSPSTLNTLNELAAALGDDASFATSVATSLGNKQDKSTLGADTATAVHAATGKSTPVDGDELLIADSAASYAPKKLTWANLKATLKTYFDTIYAALTHAARHKSGGADAIKLDELAAPTDITTLNATTSAHGLLPKLGGGTTNFLRADGSWAAPAGGGGSISTPRVYYVELGGNDSTAVPGDPAHPYLTPQAAYDDMAADSYAGMIQIGVGVFAGSITVSAPPLFPISIRGRGMHVSSIGGIFSGGISLNVSSDQSVILGNVSLSGFVSGSPTGEAGANGGNLGMVGCVASAITLNGTVGNPGTNGEAGNDTTPGYNGGTGGTGGTPGRFQLRDCIIIGAVNCLRGAGGTGGAGGADGGTGAGSPGSDGSEGTSSTGNYAYRCVLGGGIAFSPSDSTSDVSLGQNIYGATIDNGAQTELGGSISASAIPFYS
jgi:hypothetical protein